MINLKKHLQENKLFFLFLAVHFIVWSSIGLIRNVLPTDSLEGIYWASLHDFGTPKHPPLAAWLTYIAYMPFKIDFFVYLLSQSFIIIGFIYIYKLAKDFLDQNSAMLSVIILEGCWCYNYVTGYYGFNPDVVLYGMLPAITYYFWKCMSKNLCIDWVKLGLCVGFAFLDKYQTGMLVIAMAIWAFIFRRKTYTNKFFYLAISIAFFIFLPHLIWLIKYDFFPLLYFDNKLATLVGFERVSHFLLFVLMQLVMTVGALLTFFALKFKAKSKFELTQNQDEKFWFLIIMMFVPFIIHLIMCLISGGNVRPQWNYIFWYLIGITLFYCFPIEITQKEFSFTLKIAYTIMLIVFLSFGTMLTVEKNYRSRYPVSDVYSGIETLWHNECGNAPLKYIGGHTEWAYPLVIYSKSHPTYIMETFGYRNIWIDENDLKTSGAFIISRKSDEVIHYTKENCPYLPTDYKIQPKEYSFELYNALKMPRTYQIYYFIVPPMK